MSFVLFEIKLQKSFERIMLAVILLAANGFAAELTILAISPDGRSETSCKMESFRPIHVGSKVERDYKSQFRGLSGSGIPSGNYEARIACGDDGQLMQTINLVDESQFELVAFSGRSMRSEPSGPDLVVELAIVPRG